METKQISNLMFEVTQYKQKSTSNHNVSPLRLNMEMKPCKKRN